jgi:hypothetical protein
MTIRAAQLRKTDRRAILQFHFAPPDDPGVTIESIQIWSLWLNLHCESYAACFRERITASCDNQATFPARGLCELVQTRRNDRLIKPVEMMDWSAAFPDGEVLPGRNRATDPILGIAHRALKAFALG